VKLVPQEDNNTDAWYLRRDNQVRGPFPSGKVRHLILEGEVFLDDEVSLDRKEWKRVSKVKAVVPLQMRRDGSVDEEAFDKQSSKEKTKAIVTTLVLTVLVAGFVWLVMFSDQSGQQSASDCLAPASPGVNWENCRFDAADLTGADLSAALLSNSSFQDAKLANAVLEKADMRFTSLIGADLSYARLAGVDLKGANLRGADLTYADLQGANLSYADLTGAKIGGAALTKARLEGTIWIDRSRCATGSITECRPESR